MAGAAPPGVATSVTDHPLVGSLLARCTFPPPGTRVACAVSGGADSSALVVLAVAAGCDVTAVHVDHGLRHGSAAEAAVVEALTKRFGARFEGRTVVVGRGGNIEARARRARYDALPPGVLTGHTADDQAETILINMLRGAATSGLAGMRPGHHRPLLGLRRTETQRLCETFGIQVIDDPTNADARHLRNRVRHELIPLLDDLARRDVVPVLVRQAALLRADDDLLAAQAAGLDPQDARALAAAPAPLAARAVRGWLGDEHPPSAAAVQRVVDVATGTAGACEIAGGQRVRRRNQRLERLAVAETAVGQNHR